MVYKFELLKPSEEDPASCNLNCNTFFWIQTIDTAFLGGIGSTVRRRCRIYWMKNWRLYEPSHHGWTSKYTYLSIFCPVGYCTIIYLQLAPLHLDFRPLQLFFLIAKTSNIFIEYSLLSTDPKSRAFFKETVQTRLSNADLTIFFNIFKGRIRWIENQIYGSCMVCVLFNKQYFCTSY